MTYTVIVTEAAERDLHGIASYLVARFASRQAARDALDRFHELTAKLAETPTAFAIVNDALLAQVGYRWAPLGSYLAFFIVDKADGTVSIDRILHGQKNWQAIL